MECMCGVTSAFVVLYMRTGVCNLCYAFRNSSWPRYSGLEHAFSKAKVRSFSKANGRLSATWNTSLLDLLLVYRVASHSGICKIIIIIIIYTASRVCTSVLSFIYVGLRVFMDGQYLKFLITSVVYVIERAASNIDILWHKREKLRTSSARNSAVQGSHSFSSLVSHGGINRYYNHFLSTN